MNVNFDKIDKVKILDKNNKVVEEFEWSSATVETDQDKNKTLIIKK